jgi:hypothetical protein
MGIQLVEAENMKGGLTAMCPSYYSLLIVFPASKVYERRT